MSPADFDREMLRIIDVFGKSAFSDERKKLIWQSVRDLDANEWRAVVNHFVASARHAPLPKDFADAAKAERSKRFHRDVEGAAKVLYHPSRQEGLKRFLEMEGASSVTEAIEMARLRNRRGEGE